MVKKTIIHEGKGWVLHRADGSTERQEPVLISANVTIPNEAIRSGDVVRVQHAFAEASQEMSKKQDGLLFKRLDEANKNVVDAGGRVLTAELMLDVFRTKELQFDEDGNWSPPTLVSGAPNADKELRRLAEDPTLQAQLGVKIEARRERWLDRERSRKLVD